MMENGNYMEVEVVRCIQSENNNFCVNFERRKENMTEKITGFLKIFLLTCVFIVGMSLNTKAATPKVATLPIGQTYKMFDLDNDGKKDSIKMVVGNGGYITKGYIYINGVKVYTMQLSNGSQDALLKILKLKNGKNYILCSLGIPDEGKVKNVLLQYKKKKIKVIDNFSELDKYASTSYISRIKVSRNAIAIQISAMTWSLGGTQMTFHYVYDSGILKKVKTVINNNAKKKFTAAQKFSVYKQPGCNRSTFTVWKGDYVTVAKFYRKKGVLWICVKNSLGQSGWVKGEAGYRYNGLFANAMYAS